MLQEFLNHQFVNISDDEDLSKLKKACDDLIKKLLKEPSKIASFAVAAFDPEIEPENSDLNEVDVLVTKYWKTFRVNAKDRRITILRAVILESLEQLSRKEIKLTCLVWLATRNIIKYLALGREEELLTDFLSRLGNKIEKEASRTWSLEPVEADLGTQDVEFELSEVTGQSIDRDLLTKQLGAAAGPTDNEGQPYPESPNPHNPSSGSSWTNLFASKAAVGIAGVVNKALREQAAVINGNQLTIQESLKRLIKKLESVIVQTHRDIIENNALFNMRTQLLWWREAMHSKQFETSYRKLDPRILEIALAFDYARVVPFIYPASADFFLVETYRQLSPKEADSKPIKIADLLHAVEFTKAHLIKLFESQTEKNGRKSLLDFVGGLVSGKEDLKQLKAAVGIDPNAEVPREDFMLWLFHDLQATKIGKEKIER